MNNLVFGEVFFSAGWNTKMDITLFGNSYNVVVRAMAYYEKDGITAEQEKEFGDFSRCKNDRIKTVEKLLNSFADGKASKRFSPRTLLFQRNGGFALLLDDSEDEDGGVAVCLSPEEKVLLQDEYL